MPISPVAGAPRKKCVSIRLASSQDIESWSCGEVTRPETIDYRNRKPVDGGLFCERIFGPLKDWECACGKYRGVRYQGRHCDRCRVQIGKASLRRQRMGHISLCAPVIHVWLFRSRPSRLATLLAIKPKDLEQAIYYQGWLVIEPGGSGYGRGALIDAAELKAARSEFAASGFLAETGAVAVEMLLARLDLNEASRELREQIGKQGALAAVVGARSRTGKQLRRLHLIEDLLASGNELESLVLRKLPVIPADLRPLVALPDGAFAASDVNELYRRVVARNQRLAQLQSLGAPRVLLQNELRLLQQSVDALLDNRRAARSVLGASRRPLRCLAELIEGKDGRFRQSLLGKRVDYSARSVIVVGPELKLDECGLPKPIATALFRPFVLRRLVEVGHAGGLKAAKAMLAASDPRALEALTEVMQHHPVLLNRAPTLHRMNIRAFYPRLVDGNAIRLHALACKGFNADFDGDQMAVHLPLSTEAQVEARVLLLASANLFSPANGKPVVGLSQDIVLGCHYATLARHSLCGQRPSESKSKTLTASLAAQLWERGALGLHDEVSIRLEEGRAVLADEARVDASDDADDAASLTAGPARLPTTVGRILFNQLLPPGMPFVNRPLTDRLLAKLVQLSHDRSGRAATVELLDRIKQFGFQMATRSGLSLSLDDLRPPISKPALVAAAEAADTAIRQAYSLGRMSLQSRAAELIDVWSKTSQKVAEHTLAEMEASQRAGQPLNGVYVMVRSGARGGFEQVRQLAGMRGLMTRPNGQILETPIKSSFREGLGVLEYFQSTHGARKGLADTALRTAQAGHLTRRLADAAQNVLVTTDDCGCTSGVWLTNEKRPLSASVAGRVLARRVVVQGQVLAERGDLVSRRQAEAMGTHGVQRVLVRSPLTCRARPGVCQQCYGADLATNELVELGAAVGVIAAQSIGEPGVQLTMRTFHQGGAVGQKGDITQGLPRVVQLFEARGRKAAFPASEDLEPRRVALGQAIISAAQSVFAQQGAEVHDKHFEVILACMLRKVRVLASGDTGLAPGRLVDRIAFQEANDALRDKVLVLDSGASSLPAGKLVSRREFQSACAAAATSGMPPRCRPAEPAAGETVLLGVSQAALASESFLSSASFQETAKMLLDAALAGRVDMLEGLKENVILGELPPCGGGYFTRGSQPDEPSAHRPSSAAVSQ